MNSEQDHSKQNSAFRILVVDDEPKNIEILIKLLKEKGYQTRAARDGDFAVRTLQKETVDLILLDIMMPGMSGFDVCTTLKKDRLTESIPIIFLTAINETKEKVKAFELGAVDYITKPFDLDEVLARVARQLKLKTEYKKSDKTGEYRRTSLDEEKRKEICKRLIDYFEEEKPYLSDGLNAETIARKLKISRHNLGEAVNLEKQQNISSFINFYRIDHFCKLLEQQPDAPIFDLALQSGYTAKSVFHKWFKLIKKTTPKKYIKSFME